MQARLVEHGDDMAEEDKNPQGFQARASGLVRGSGATSCRAAGRSARKSQSFAVLCFNPYSARTPSSFGVTKNFNVAVQRFSVSRQASPPLGNLKASLAVTPSSCLMRCGRLGA